MGASAVTPHNPLRHPRKDTLNKFMITGQLTFHTSNLVDRYEHKANFELLEKLVPKRIIFACFDFIRFNNCKPHKTTTNLETRPSRLVN